MDGFEPFDALPVAVAEVDGEDRIIWGNLRLSEILGIPREALSGQGCESLVQHHEDAEGLRRAFYDARVSGQPGSFQRMATVAGEDRFVDYRFRPKEGSTHLWVVAYFNERAHRLRRVVEAREQMLDAFMRHCPAFAWMRREDGTYVMVNARYLEHYGLREENIIGSRVEDRWPSAVAEMFRRHDLHVLETGEARRFIEHAPDPDGRLHTFANVKFKVVDEQQRSYVGAVGLDITKEMQVERREALAIMASAFAHDFSQALTAIVAFGETALSETDPTADAAPHLREVLAAAQRAAQLVDSLQSFHGAASSMPLTDPARVVEQALHGVRPFLDERVELSVAVVRVATRVRVDPGVLRRVVEALLLFAVRSVGADGHVRLSLQEGLHLLPGRPGAAVRLSVEDDGAGLSEDDWAEWFEQGANPHQPRGLGLRGVRPVVAAWGGQFLVHSPPEGGSVFEVLLPSEEI